MIRVLIGIIGVVAIGGGAYLYTRPHDSTPTPAQQEQSSHPASAEDFASIIASGNDVQCSMTQTMGDRNTVGQMYVTDHGQKVRADLTITGSMNTTMHMIRKDDTNYLWGPQMAFGVKTTVTPENQDQFVGNQMAIGTTPTNMEFSCTPWTVDESKFELPAGQNFIDSSTMHADDALRSASMNNGVPTTEISPAAQAAQCAMCTQAGLSAETCHARFGCSE